MLLRCHCRSVKAGACMLCPFTGIHCALPMPSTVPSVLELMLLQSVTSYIEVTLLTHHCRKAKLRLACYAPSSDNNCALPILCVVPSVSKPTAASICTSSQCTETAPLLHKGSLLSCSPRVQRYQAAQLHERHSPGSRSELLHSFLAFEPCTRFQAHT